MSPEIQNYHFGEITIEGESYRKDLIIFPERVRPNWWRTEGHRLGIEDLEEVLEEPPEVLVIGMGAVGQMKVPAETEAHLRSQGIEIIAQKTKEACQSYNELRDQKKVIAALHLTC